MYVLIFVFGFGITILALIFRASDQVASNQIDMLSKSHKEDEETTRV